jgi:hypothetical protein
VQPAKISHTGYSAACGNHGFLHCAKGASCGGLPKIHLVMSEEGSFSQAKDYVGNLNTFLCSHNQGEQNNV